MSKIYLATIDDLKGLTANKISLYPYMKELSVVGAASNVNGVTATAVFNDDTESILLTPEGTISTSATSGTFSLFLGPFSFSSFVKLGFKNLSIYMVTGSSPHFNTSDFVISSSQSFSSGVVYSKNLTQTTSSSPIYDTDNINITNFTGNYYFGIKNTTKSYQVGTDKFGFYRNPIINQLFLSK